MWNWRARYSLQQSVWAYTEGEGNTETLVDATFEQVVHAILLQTWADYMYGVNTFFPLMASLLYITILVSKCARDWHTIYSDSGMHNSMPTIEVTKTVCVAENVLLGKYCFTKHCFCVLITRLHWRSTFIHALCCPALTLWHWLLNFIFITPIQADPEQMEPHSLYSTLWQLGELDLLVNWPGHKL